jgi:hypothetical protein
MAHAALLPHLLRLLLPDGGARLLAPVASGRLVASSTPCCRPLLLRPLASRPAAPARARHVVSIPGAVQVIAVPAAAAAAASCCEQRLWQQEGQVCAALCRLLAHTAQLGSRRGLACKREGSRQEQQSTWVRHLPQHSITPLLVSVCAADCTRPGSTHLHRPPGRVCPAAPHCGAAPGRCGCAGVGSPSRLNPCQTLQDATRDRTGHERTQSMWRQRGSVQDRIWVCAPSAMHVSMHPPPFGPGVQNHGLQPTAPHMNPQHLLPFPRPPGMPTPSM